MKKVIVISVSAPIWCVCVQEVVVVGFAISVSVTVSGCAFVCGFEEEGEYDVI